MYNTTEKREKRPINTSAVVRIVIWSIVLCVLSGVFAAAMIAEGAFGGGFAIGKLSIGGYVYENADTYTVGGGTYDGTVREIDIDWVDGDIDIVPTDETAVRIEEDYSGDDRDLRLRWKVEDGELTIKYRKSHWLISVGDASLTKRLTVYVPRAMLDALEDVDIDMVESDVSFSGRAHELSLDGVNGSLTVNGHVGELNVDFVDGRLDFTGTLGNGDLDGVDLEATLRLDAARSLDIDGVDHRVTLYLADTVTGFCLNRDSIGGDTIVEGFEQVEVTDAGDRRWGDGSFVIDADGVDSKLNIKKLTKD